MCRKRSPGLLPLSSATPDAGERLGLLRFPKAFTLQELCEGKNADVLLLRFEPLGRDESLKCVRDDFRDPNGNNHGSPRLIYSLLAIGPSWLLAVTRSAKGHAPINRIRRARNKPMNIQRPASCRNMLLVCHAALRADVAVSLANEAFDCEYLRSRLPGDYLHCRCSDENRWRLQFSSSASAFHGSHRILRELLRKAQRWGLQLGHSKTQLSGTWFPSALSGC